MSPSSASSLVSIIVPVFNRPKPLLEAVESALAQTHRPIEVVVVDDGSTDDTPAVAAELAAVHPAEVRVVRRHNGGPGLARETGRLVARGAYLQYLDSDDLLLPRKLELQVEALRARPECGIAYGVCRETEPDGSERRPALRSSDRAIETLFPTFVAERWWNTVTPLYRAELCARAGPWSGLRLEEDWEYDARVAALWPRLVFVPEIVAVHRDLGSDRLSRGAALDPVRLAWRAEAHCRIAASALRAGVRADAPEMWRLARELFLLARWCAAAGVPASALLRASLDLGQGGRHRLEVLVFRGMTGILGDGRAGRLARWVDRLRGAGARPR